MKLAFSTLGCPGWSFEEIFATAKDLGMNGIEIRGVASTMYAPNIKMFQDEMIEKTKETFKKASLEISMLTSGCDLSDEENIDKMMQEARDYIDLAQKLGVSYVRIMCENAPGPQKDFDLDVVAKRYREICDYANGKDVYPLIETNSLLADSKVMRDFIKTVDRDNAFVLWDVHHPYRYFKENVYDTAKNLEGLVKYVHVKDSKVVDGKNEYRMMGYGDVSILDALKALKAQGFDGYVSLEWVKRWCADLQEPGIVFSHYANYMGYLIRQI